MDRVLKIARSGSPATGLQFRERTYGVEGIERFLKDVLAIANASVDGARHIITGIRFDLRGDKCAQEVAAEDFSGRPAYQSLVAEHIEPPLRISYEPAYFEGKRIGIFEISDCRDTPYMMRIDFSETLRRGDAYLRVDDDMVKLGRRQLQKMFERKFRESVSHDNIEVGFPGEIIHKDLRLPTTDLSLLPSAIAAGKLKQLVEIRNRFSNTGATTVLARLTHARLFGSDSPYEDRSAEQLLHEVGQIRQRHRHEDQHFLYERNGQELRVVVYNQGSEAIENASLSLVFPDHESLYVATGLPARPKDDRWIPRDPDEIAAYPAVSRKGSSIRVSSALGEIPADARAEAFRAPLRLCAGDELRGRKIGIRYSVFGSNLRKPAQGRLRLLL